MYLQNTPIISRSCSAVLLALMDDVLIGGRIRLGGGGELFFFFLAGCSLNRAWRRLPAPAQRCRGLYLTRWSVTGPSIRNWTSSRRGAAAPLCFRLAAGGGAARERFSKFVYRQLTGEKLPAGSLIETDSGCFFFRFVFLLPDSEMGLRPFFPPCLFQMFSFSL